MDWVNSFFLTFNGMLWKTDILTPNSAPPGVELKKSNKRFPEFHEKELKMELKEIPAVFFRRFRNL